MRRHDTDAVSLVFGLLFTALVGWWLLNRIATIHVSGGWPVAAALLTAGLVGLLTTRPHRPDPQPTVDLHKNGDD